MTKEGGRDEESVKWKWGGVLLYNIKRYIIQMCGRVF